MPKGRSFAAKLAHELTSEGKVICPTCNTEVKKIKIVKARTSKNGNWAPKYLFQSMCKCNEKDILEGKL